jgi:16S rRNA (cytosine967-C5)-methyltransferase
LRNIIRNLDQVKYPEQNQPVPYLAVYYSQPEWLVEKLLSDLGRADTEKILAYFNQKPSLTMRTNRLKGSRDRLAELLAAEGIKCHASPLTPDAIVVDHLNRPLAESGSYREGWFYMQNEAAMLAASILSPGRETG